MNNNMENIMISY